MSSGKIPMQFSGHQGLHPWTVRPDYKTYKSPHGPKYTEAPHFHGLGATRISQFGKTAAMFGAAAGIFAFFFFAEVPRVRDDISTKLPIIGGMFKKEVAPEDNPF